MALLGFHASHEQLAPSELLRVVRSAEVAGFDAAMCSDHLAPWTSGQGHAGHAWSWLGAALASTSLGFGAVTAPGQRYHPAVAAQAIATLAEMFPGRFWVALGSGEALNEHVTGDRWPDKPTRDARLLECVDVIRRLLAGEEVTHRGLVTVDRARVWSRPAEPPPLLGAAVSAGTARSVGHWADGLITVNQPTEVLRIVLDEFRQGGGAAKPAYVQVHVAWARTDDEALALARDQWAYGVLDSTLTWNLELPEQFEAAIAHVPAEAVRDAVFVSSDLAAHAAKLHELVELGFDGVYVHHVGKNQEEFLDMYADAVLPQLR